MTLVADNCEIVIDSDGGRLMVLSFQMAYLIAAVNDGILAEVSFDLTDEDTGKKQNIRAQLRLDKVE